MAGTSSRTVHRGPCAGPIFHSCPCVSGVACRHGSSLGSSRGDSPDTRPSAFQAGHIPKSPRAMQAGRGAADHRLPLVAAVAVTVAVTVAVGPGSVHDGFLFPRGNCPVTACTVQAMARVRFGQAAAWPLSPDRSARRGLRDQARLRVYVHQAPFTCAGCPAGTVTVEAGRCGHVHSAGHPRS